MNRKKHLSSGSSIQRWLWPNFASTLFTFGIFIEPVTAEMPTSPLQVEARWQQPAQLAVEMNRRTLIDTYSRQLYTDTNCSVSVQAEALDRGMRLDFTVTNPTDTPQTAPALQVPGIALPKVGTQRLANWKTVFWLRPLADINERERTHPARAYPMDNYAPVLGLRTNNAVVGVAALYDVFQQRYNINMDYRFDRSSETWTLVLQPVGEVVRRANGRFVSNFLTLQPGASLELSMAIQVTEPMTWLDAFSAYRDHFHQQFGERRQQRASDEPIFAYSLSSRRQSEVGGPDNPRTFFPLRIDQHGWPAFVEKVQEHAIPNGFERIMIWHASGRYLQHPKWNMAWEISTAWVPKQVETATDFRRLSSEMGLTVGLWWGRALGISPGFDSGHRYPWNPDDPEHNRLAFRELDLAYERGVRMIGLDGVGRSLQPNNYRPGSDIAFERILPLLRERYPDIHLIIEPAANDYLHLLGSSYVWDREVGGPLEFANYLAADAEINVAMKRGYMMKTGAQWQTRFDQHRWWGYIPIVFSSPQGKAVKVPQFDNPAEWPSELHVTTSDLRVRFDAAAAWTLRKVDTGEHAIGIDRRGLSYGTAGNFKTLGLVGSSHIETGNHEKVTGLLVEVDGRKIRPTDEIIADKVSITKRSRIMSLALVERWIMGQGKIVNDVSIEALERTPLDLLYVGMLPFSDEMTDYAWAGNDNKTETGNFITDKKLWIGQPARWLAVYNRNSGIGATIQYAQLPSGLQYQAGIQDRQGFSKKHHLMTFVDREVPQGSRYHFRIIIEPFKAPADDWVRHAKTSASIAQ